MVNNEHTYKAPISLHDNNYEHRGIFTVLIITIITQMSLINYKH